MHFVGYCIKCFVAVSAVGFPDILLCIMHPLSNKYIQEIITDKFCKVICIYTTQRTAVPLQCLSFPIFFFLLAPYRTLYVSIWFNYISLHVSLPIYISVSLVLRAPHDPMSHIMLLDILPYHLSICCIALLLKYVSLMLNTSLV